MNKITVDKKLIKRLKPFLQAYLLYEQKYSAELYKLETNMSEITGIIDMEFIFWDNEFVGIGNADRTMRLIHREELE